MEFHLVYDGNLLRPQQSDNRRVWEKHAIRAFLSPQLESLWKTHPALKYYGEKTVEIDEYERRVSPPKPFLDHLADRHKVEDLGIIPIMTEANGLVCSLNILLLRPDYRGAIEAGGDIDNRLKTLIDALTKPKPGQLKTKDGVSYPNPMYCLMEDDKQVKGLAVETDRLLYSMDGGQHDAIAIVKVTTAQVDPFGSPWELHL